MALYSLVLGAMVALLLAATLLAKLPLRWWWIRACEFPRLQLAYAAVLTALLSLPLEPPWRWALLGTSLLVVALQARFILPWTRLWPVQVQSADPGQQERCITLLIANVLTPNRQASRLIEIIRRHDPDVVLTLESDDWWQERLDQALEENWPNSVKIPLDNLYGMHLYSRLPLDNTRVEWLIQEDIPSIHTDVKLETGDRLTLHALHPRPPAPNESEESLWRDAELLLVGKEIHRNPKPTVVAGDLNDVAWSRTTRLFCRISGMLDPRRGRGRYSTFHARYPLLRWPLDHIFTSEHFTLKKLERLPGFGSDHFPILATLCFRPSRSDEHENPEADGDERAWARQTIREARRREQEP
ncbi:endonuclease/exonuclease/phosphatase family protein [Billgrantia diversa]|uniref:endonuclease/exonuclease/phosphatase family protein n=1 Tax=Halomonas sp. MCCC 1A13316 TaxID=2733487 RepID=UPI0018A46AE9|nr:endonuclease/exonuclease/phosphatase family protein [Halomonas sp. MCCC 1A13316]QOR38658.1 endonuclease/exonuclease/phosphatase family protein [Halomonas sp. MCCC 1A13316]